jgi:hypothetical protein
MKIAEIHEPDALWLEFNRVAMEFLKVEAGNRAPVIVEVEPSFYAWMATTVWRDTNSSVLAVLSQSSGLQIMVKP